jgi:hypothetical protein
VSFRLLRLLTLALVLCVANAAAAQQTPPSPDANRPVDSPRASRRSSVQDADGDHGWTVGFNSVIFGTFNRQGGLRGDTEVVSQNWAMAMATRRAGRGVLTVSGMLSAEPFTAPNPGYSALFQQGEAYRGLQITDHQHPHDLLMQLSATWRVRVGEHYGVTLAGGPQGEATLGPVAFMHRPSSFENPTAPLSHHIFDSTHISSGALLAGVDRGPVSVEASWFRGREPDENRYDLDTGRLDSWATRVWVRPGREWTIQASHGRLHEPEQLEPGDQRRTSASASWLRERGANFTAVTAALGRNQRTYSRVRAALVEFTHHRGRTSVYGRFEDLTVETEILLFPEIVHQPHPGELVDPIRTMTGGAVRDVANVRGFKVGIGGDVSIYRVPPLLQFTHAARPVSFHLFVRVRPPMRGGRMWNMTMGRPMGSHDGMSGHRDMTHQHPSDQSR